MTTILRLSSVYGAPPIFNRSVAEMGYVETLDLGLSIDLRTRIEAWNTKFQETFRDEDPAQSRFDSINDLINHNNEGVYLARDLQKELGSIFLIEYLALK